MLIASTDFRMNFVPEKLSCNMARQTMYKDYFQKSKVFLYPALGYPRGDKGGIVPDQTYVSWKNEIQPTDMKLICVFDLYSPEFKKYEAEKIFTHPRFEKLWHLDDGKAAYIFDLSCYEHNWNMFLKGKYSMMNDSIKYKIKNYFKGLNTMSGYVRTWLYPEEFYWLYAEILGVKLKHLKYAGELCDVPNMDKEMLIAQKTGFEVPKNIH
jgi:hypothetical protein